MIIVIDDEKDIAESFQMLLELSGKEVVSFTKQQEAADYIQENLEEVEIVFCDNRMPCGSGISFLKSLPESLRKCLVTGDRPEKESHFEIVHKPFHLDEIMSLLDSAA
jgi:DNA-binding NtrC family response regulator